MFTTKISVLLARITAALLLIIFCVHFSNAYFSYAAGVFFLFAVYDCLSTHGAGIFSASSLRAMKLPAAGIFTFYGTLLLSGVLLNDYPSVGRSLDYALLCFPFFMLFLLRRKYDVDSGVKWGLLIGCLIICIGAFMQGGYNGTDRLFSFFAHPNHLGTGIALLLPFTVYYFFKAAAPAEKVITGLLIPLLFYCLYHTGARGAIMGLAAAIGVSLFLLPFASGKHLPKKTVCAFILAAILFTCIGAGLVCVLNENRSLGGERLFMLQASYEMWADHKLLGVGLDNWSTFYYSETYHPANARELGLSMAHNMPAHFFATAGLLGGLGYLAFLFAFFYALCRLLKNCEDKLFAAAAMTAFLAFAAQGLVDTTIINKIPARLFYALMGYALAKSPLLSPQIKN